MGDRITIRLLLITLLSLFASALVIQDEQLAMNQTHSGNVPSENTRKGVIDYAQPGNVTKLMSGAVSFGEFQYAYETGLDFMEVTLVSNVILYQLTAMGHRTMVEFNLFPGKPVKNRADAFPTGNNSVSYLYCSETVTFINGRTGYIWETYNKSVRERILNGLHMVFDTVQSHGTVFTSLIINVASPDFIPVIKVKYKLLPRRHRWYHNVVNV